MNRGVVVWRSKAWKSLNRGNTYGQIVSMSFKKSRNDTYLRLTWSSNLRQYYNGQCSQWYFKINGNECSSPAPVDLNIYQNIGGAHNIFRHSTVVGVCRATAAGTLQSASYQISVNVRGCPRWTAGDALTGWSSTSTMMVEELCPPV